MRVEIPAKYKVYGEGIASDADFLLVQQYTTLCDIFLVTAEHTKRAEKLPLSFRSLVDNPLRLLYHRRLVQTISYKVITECFITLY